MELGQTQSATDLIPGSSANARAAAEAWKKRSEAAVALRDHLAKLDDDGAWSGNAYDLYQERFERQLLHWKKTGTSLMDGASALYTWADALDWARDEADRAITL